MSFWRYWGKADPTYFGFPKWQMNRVLFRRGGVGRGVPRMRGDEPKERAARGVTIKCSPHAGVLNPIHLALPVGRLGRVRRLRLLTTGHHGCCPTDTPAKATGAPHTQTPVSRHSRRYSGTVEQNDPMKVASYCLLNPTGADCRAAFTSARSPAYTSFV